MQQATRDMLTKLFDAGVKAVKGEAAVRAWIETSDRARPTHIFAAGKAAVSMFEGLPDDWRSTIPSLIVTKTDHLGDAAFGANVKTIEASHPVPDAASLAAGQMALDFVSSCPEDSRILCLISGGASSLVEHLKDGIEPEELFELTKALLADGADIAEINSRRKEISAVKGGNLLAHFKGQSVVTLAVSDVCGDGVDVIGSGLGDAPANPTFTFTHQIIGSNAVARAAVETTATMAGLNLATNDEVMYADVVEVADRIAKEVSNGPAGLYIFGGEPTVVLPENPGQGGRNQALALELALRFRKQSDVFGLVAGTDGSDGPTQAAGGFFDGQSFDIQQGAQAALDAANSAEFLARTGYQLVTGPTGTNVMDLALILKN